MQFILLLTMMILANLSEISSPVPVKFAGEGKDAIGYIEKNGKLYTIPVTRNQYEELTKK